MKKTLILALFAILTITFIYCETTASSKEEAIAQKYCGSCHVAPKPSSLTTEIWKNGILPEMSLYYVWSKGSKYEYANQIFIKKGALPMTDEIWKFIEAYYLMNSPSEMEIRPNSNLPLQDEFEEITYDTICEMPFVTALQIEEDGEILCACDNYLRQLDQDFKANTLLRTSFVISQMERKSDEEIYILNIGKLKPHDQPFGALNIYNTKEKKGRVIRDTLFRPVFINRHDSLIYISEYGNNKGRLSVLEENSKVLKSISNLSGAYRSFFIDANNDGKEELIAQFSQANEAVYQFSKKNDGTYESKVLLSFPPEFGFSDLDTADINGDGFVDLVVSNGDNADYSMIEKNYHGVRVYLNDKKGNFEEQYFYPLYGATQLRCFDVENDGKMDIMVAAFFPNDIEESLILLTNRSESEIKFKAKKFANAPKGRWMVMEDGDIDQDGDVDVILGSYINGPSKLEQSILNQWKKESVDILILRNKVKR